MAKKKLVKKQAPAPKKEDRTVQYIGIGVLLLVAGFFAWQIVSNAPQKMAARDEIPASSGITEGVCDPFNSIPVAAQYDQPPQAIDESAAYFANVKMQNGGEFKFYLYADRAPITVNSFVFLACKGFFNGVTFHRVLDGFMAQGGDPSGTGAGGPGYQFVNEDSDLTFDRAGVVAMANAGRDTNGSQFFITFAPAEYLNGGYTIFGQVVEGMDVVNSITRRNPDEMPQFEGDKIESVTISY